MPEKGDNEADSQEMKRIDNIDKLDLASSAQIEVLPPLVDYHVQVPPFKHSTHCRCLVILQCMHL